MDDPVLNCLLLVCCESPQAEETLAGALVKSEACDREYALKTAAWILAHFDLAEKGTLTPLKASIARLARGPRLTDAS